MNFGKEIIAYVFANKTPMKKLHYCGFVYKTSKPHGGFFIGNYPPQNYDVKAVVV